MTTECDRPRPGLDLLGRLAAKVRPRRDSHPAKPVLLVTSAEPLHLGLDLIARAEVLPVARCAGVLYSDGLIIALLALRPLRRKNLTDLTIGSDLTSNGSGWSIFIPASASKTHVPLAYDWPPVLLRALGTYLSAYRPLLLDRTGRWHRDVGNRLWVSTDGSPTTQVAIADRVRRYTASRFGFPISPHTFRHCAATTLAVHFSTDIREAGPLLGHRDPRTTEEHYIRGSGLEAHRAFGDHLAEVRREVLR